MKRSILLILLLALTPLLSFAQFGSAVAAIDDEVFVVNPGGAFGGLATVYAFRSSEDGWNLHERFYAPGSAKKGLALGRSLAASDGQLIAAAADAKLRLGAYSFSYDGERWVSKDQIRLAEADLSRPSSATLGEIMQIIQPPARLVSARGDVLAITVPTGPTDVEGLHLFSRNDTGWSRDTLITLEDNGFGLSVSAGADRVLVGAASGSAYVFGRDGNGWKKEAALQGGDLSASTQFGASVLLTENVAIVGAPGADTTGHVLIFKRDEDGNWMETQRLSSPENTMGDAFGGSLAKVGDEIWVGATRANERRGAVYRFTRDDSEDTFISAGPLEIDGLEPGSFFGISMAGTGTSAIVGAPGADGNMGMAAVFEKDENGNWNLASWLRPEEPLETIAGEEHRCEDGKASGFTCDNVDLLSFLPISALGAERREQVSDLWGWTDPLDGREYALIGRTSGATIVDITNPTMPEVIGLVPANPTWVRDLKVYEDHLFFTGDNAGDHGLVVFDLTRIRNAERPTSFEPDTVYHGIASAHNLILDDQSGFAYAVGSSQGGETCGGGLHMVDIREPKNPTFAGCFTDTVGLFSDGRTHDGQCTIYRGPDDRYGGRQICFASNETALRIVDVTDKSNPVPIAAARYPRTAYVHQGWLTEDHRYFYLDDELDEIVGMTDRTRTLIWDISELDDPVLVGEFTGSTEATDHNLYTKGNRMYQANYQGGLSIWDISNPVEPIEIGHFDTTSADGNPPGFAGAWTAYPYFESGTIIVSSINEGLFVVKPSRQTP